MATSSISRALAGSSSTSSLGASGSVHQTDESAPRADGTQRNVAVAWRGTRASSSTATTTEMPAVGHSSSSWDDEAPDRRRPTVEHDEDPRPAVVGSPCPSVAVRVRATSTSWRTSSAAALGLAVRWEPASGDVADRVWGSHFTHVPSPVSRPSTTAMTRSSGLCRQAAWISTDEHIAASRRECVAVQADHAELGRG